MLGCGHGGQRMPWWQMNMQKTTSDLSVCIIHTLSKHLSKVYMVSGLYIILAMCAFRKAHKNLQSTMFWQTRLKTEFCSCCGWCFVSKSTIASYGWEMRDDSAFLGQAGSSPAVIGGGCLGRMEGRGHVCGAASETRSHRPFLPKPKAALASAPAVSLTLGPSLLFALWHPEVSNESFNHEQYISRVVHFQADPASLQTQCLASVSTFQLPQCRFFAAMCPGSHSEEGR